MRLLQPIDIELSKENQQPGVYELRTMKLKPGCVRKDFVKRAARVDYVRRRLTKHSPIATWYSEFGPLDTTVGSQLI